MSLFISEAWAQGAGGQGNPIITFGMFAMIFVLFYVLLIRPQQKRQKQHREMVTNLKKGDEVVTAGGTLGRITDLSDNFITIEIADGVEIKVQRHSVQAMMPKGTMGDA